MRDDSLVHIVDDDDAVRDGISLLLRSVGLQSTGYRNGQEFLEKYDGSGPACALFDMRMPGLSGMELLREVRNRRWDVPVVIITGHGDVPLAVEAMKEGALDFLQKPFREEELLQRIRQALTVHAQSHSQSRARNEAQRRLQNLTPREAEVARRVADGQANKVIAIELDISLRTVELHRARVMEKMGAASVADLVRLMLEAQQDS